MKSIFLLALIIFLSACEGNKCKTCKTEITTQGYPQGPMKISLIELGSTKIPLTLESENFYLLCPMTIVFEACGKESKKINGKEITIKSGDYKIILKTTCQ